MPLLSWIFRGLTRRRCRADRYAGRIDEVDEVGIDLTCRIINDDEPADPGREPPLKCASYQRSACDPGAVKRQAEAAKAYAEARGMNHRVSYADLGSGTANVARSGLGNLLRDARAGAFDVVILEDLNRLSRDFADLLRITQQLELAGVEIHLMYWSPSKPLHASQGR